MLKDLQHAFGNLYTLNLLIWSIVSTAGFYQVISYTQLLWSDVSKSNPDYKDRQTLWNGAIETVYTLLGALATFTIGKIKLQWHKFTELLLVINAIIMAAMLFIMSQTELLWVAYATYIAFMIFYQATITVVNSEIAKNLKEDSYGLVFGVAMFFALVAQTILTAVVVSGSGFALPPRSQYVVYGGYFVCLSAILFLKIILSVIVRTCCYSQQDMSVNE